MKNIFLAIFIVLFSCAGGMNFFGKKEENNSQSRPSEEDEGVPGYLVDPDYITTYKGKDGNVYVVAKPGYVDRSEEETLHILVIEKEKIPRSVADIRPLLTPENSIEVQEDGSFRKIIKGSDQPFVILMTSAKENISATVFDFMGILNDEQDVKVTVTENMCLLQRYSKDLLAKLDDVFVDIYLRCDASKEKITEAVASMKQLICEESNQAECLQVSHQPLAQVCQVPLKYDSQDLQCDIDMFDEKSAYLNNNLYKNALAKFVIKTADWISTDIPETSISNDVDPQVEVVSCWDRSKDDRKLLVNSFVISEKTQVQVEALADDNVTVYIWRDGDPNQEVLKMIDPYDASSAMDPNFDKYLTAKQTLEPGHYLVVADVLDIHNFGHSAILAIHKTSDKSLILETDGISEWCVFDVLQSDDIHSFLKDSASCLSCYNGRGSF